MVSLMIKNTFIGVLLYVGRLKIDWTAKFIVEVLSVS